MLVNSDGIKLEDSEATRGVCMSIYFFTAYFVCMWVQDWGFGKAPAASYLQY